MTLQQIRYALAIEETLSFVKAAEKCHVAQPSLSVQIKNLESELDLIIFDRSGKTQVAITPVGQILLNRFKFIVSEIQNAVDEAKSFQSSPYGTLTVGIIPTICPYIMPHLLKYKNKHYPQLNLEISEDTTDNLLKLLNSGQLDCALLSTPNKTPKNLIEQFLYFEPFVLYAAADHPLLEKEKVSAVELAKYEVSMLDETHCMRDQVLAACKLKNNNRKIQQSKLISGSLQTLISIVDETKSFSLIPSMATEYLHFKHPKSGIRKIVNPSPKRKVSLVYNKNYERKYLINALMNCTTQGLPDLYKDTNVGTSTTIFYPDKKRFES